MDCSTDCSMDSPGTLKDLHQYQNAKKSILQHSDLSMVQLSHQHMTTQKTHCYCSVTNSWPALCDPMNWRRPGFPDLNYLPEFAQTLVHCVDDAIQSFHPLLPPSHPALYLSWHEGLLQWVRSSYQVTKVLELQLQHQSFQRIFRINFL